MLVSVSVPLVPDSREADRLSTTVFSLPLWFIIEISPPHFPSSLFPRFPELQKRKKRAPKELNADQKEKLGMMERAGFVDVFNMSGFTDTTLSEDVLTERIQSLKTWLEERNIDLRVGGNVRVIINSHFVTQLNTVVARKTLLKKISIRVFDGERGPRRGSGDDDDEEGGGLVEMSRARGGSDFPGNDFLLNSDFLDWGDNDDQQPDHDRGPPPQPMDVSFLNDISFGEGGGTEGMTAGMSSSGAEGIFDGIFDGISAGAPGLSGGATSSENTPEKRRRELQETLQKTIHLICEDQTNERQTLENANRTLRENLTILETEKRTLEDEKRTLEDEKRTLETGKRTLEENFTSLADQKKEVEISLKKYKQQRNTLKKRNGEMEAERNELLKTKVELQIALDAGGKG